MQYVVLILIGCILQGCFIESEYRNHWHAAVWLKGSASLVFVILGFVCAFGAKAFPKGGILILAGLACGMLGDILLNLRYLCNEKGQLCFVLGILIFLIGHVLYLVVLLGRVDKVYIPLVIGILITVLFMTKVLPMVKAEKPIKIFGTIYVLAVCVMAATAVWNWILVGTAASAGFGLGGVLFMFSDMVLIVNGFTGLNKEGLRRLNLITYYGGQLLIALSLML